MEAWTSDELAAVASRDKRRIWLVELQLVTGTWRAAQAIRDVRDDGGRVWTAYGANGEVQGMGTNLGRRPREVSLQLHGLTKGQSLYAKITAAGALGSPARIYLAWVDSRERLIVQPKLRFAGVIAANPTIQLSDTDRVTLILAPGTARANRLAAQWDSTPASHRAFCGVEDPIFDRVTDQTQLPKGI
jgi:hypothetical protein